jgi:hypothetical protein
MSQFWRGLIFLWSFIGFVWAMNLPEYKYYKIRWLIAFLGGPMIWTALIMGYAFCVLMWLEEWARETYNAGK